MSKVSIVRCKDYAQENVDKAVSEALGLIGGLEGLIKPQDRVLLKTNLLSAADTAKAVITHPALVGSMIRAVKEIGATPIVADSPGSFSENRNNRAIVESGIKEIADSMGVEALQFESMSNAFTEVDVPDGVWLESIHVARLALEVDVVISLAKLKTHMNTLYTGAVKNMFGVIAPVTRKAAHRLGSYSKFSGAVVDIYSTVKPQLAVMDAVVGMEGQGPSNGTPRFVGAILASRDGVALDAVASKIIGYEPVKIYTTKLAAERGLGKGDLRQINVLGETIGKVSVRFKRPRLEMTNVPTLLVGAYYWMSNVRIHVVRSKCKRCSACAESCPPGAIRMDPYPVIDRKSCIQCYCCDEVCPEGAIELKRTLLARLARFLRDLF
jgi:uncharacterized protein (DUF362 family)/Pyruvate/2-oxoacid:ferredoxin oxidoreductase delta subunit